MGIESLFTGGSGIIGGLMQAGVGAAGLYMSHKANQQNIEAQKEINQQNIEFQQRENEIMRMREDTAFQRQAADMTLAGINPNIAQGGASAQAGGIPNLVAGQVDAGIGIQGADTINKGLNSGIQAIQEMGRQIGAGLERKMKKEIADAEIDIKTGELGLKKEEFEETRNMNTKIKEEIDAKINNTKAATETQKMQAKLIYENILTAPVERMLKKAQKELYEEQKGKTTKEKEVLVERIKEIQENTKLLTEEKQESIARQCLILAEMDLKESQIEKITEEVNILIHEGNIKEFEDKIKEWDWGIEKGGQIANTVMDAIQLYFSGGLMKSQTNLNNRSGKKGKK